MKSKVIPVVFHTANTLLERCRRSLRNITLFHRVQPTIEDEHDFKCHAWSLALTQYSVVCNTWSSTTTIQSCWYHQKWFYNDRCIKFPAKNLWIFFSLVLEVERRRDRLTHLGLKTKAVPSLNLFNKQENNSTLWWSYHHHRFNQLSTNEQFPALRGCLR